MFPPRLAVFALVLLALYAIVTPALAQETTGNLEGRLVDSEGKAIAFANINVTSPSLQGGRGVMSASDGYFGLFKLPVGVYKVAISHVSYQNVVYEEVDVRLGRTTALGKVTLVSKTYEAPIVVVSEKKPLIDPTTTAVGATLTSQEFQDLPIDRDYMNITTLLPNANESFNGDGVNFAGATGQENKYFIDGAETTDPYLGVTGTRLPYNFIENIEVRTGGYEAEYRSALGGMINVVSRSGGNELHGQAFGFFVNNQFAGDTRTGVAEPITGDFAQYDAGISLGGPIAKDKLWFFGAYNPTFSTEDVDIPGQGLHEDKGITHIFAGKLDWRPSQRTHLALTATGDPGTRDAVGELFGSAGTPVSFDNPDPFLADVTTGGINVLASGTHMFNDDVMIEASVSGITRDLKMVGATEKGLSEALFVDAETGIWSGGYSTPTDDHSRQITTDVKGTFIIDRHMLKAGLGFRDNQLDFNEEYREISRYSDSSFVYYYFSGVDMSVGNRIPSAFIQDTWRMNDRLRVNAGVRWEGQWIVGSDGDVAQRITDQYQPRVGAVYMIDERGTKKASASFGRFYQELMMTIPLNALAEGTVFRVTEWDHDPRVDPSGGTIVYEQAAEIADEVDDLKGQHFDEFTLGYEQQLGDRVVVGARGIYRTLREAIEDGYSATEDATVYGNPGRGALSNLPEAKRDYRALELTARIAGGRKYSARAYYVLSRSEGNYPGLYYPDGIGNYILPNFSPAFDLEETMVNADGRLPNDRPHVFKLSGSYRTDVGLTMGTSFVWQSGTPLSVRAGSSQGSPWFNFTQERGSAGRTPSIWDLNLRFTYDLVHYWKAQIRPRLVMDVFHLGSQREPVKFDQIRNFNQDTDGNPIDFNPTYGLATRYQPPTSVRLGMEVDF
jgi:hypothetical protein